MPGAEASLLMLPALQWHSLWAASSHSPLVCGPGTESSPLLPLGRTLETTSWELTLFLPLWLFCAVLPKVVHTDSRQTQSGKGGTTEVGLKLGFGNFRILSYHRLPNLRAGRLPQGAEKVSAVSLARSLSVWTPQEHWRTVISSEGLCPDRGSMEGGLSVPPKAPCRGCCLLSSPVTCTCVFPSCPSPPTGTGRGARRSASDPLLLHRVSEDVMGKGTRLDLETLSVALLPAN